MIGVGIAGAGYFGAVHARAIAAVQELRIVAVSASSEASSATFAAEHGGRACVDWRGLLDDKEVDVILNAMPHHLHAEVTIAAAQAGKHVLVEKPMAPTLAECRAMIRAAVEAGTVLMVGQLMRYVLPCLAAQTFLAGGAIGRPRFGRSAMVKLWMESNRRDWHLSAATGGGMLLTAGIHALDRLVWLMDAPVESVAAMSGGLFHDHAVPDVDVLLLRFAGGGLGEVASVGNRDRTTWNSTELSCEGGTLLLDFDTGVRVVRDGQTEVLAGSTEPEWMLRGVEREWRDMVHAIFARAPPLVGGLEGGHLIACIEAARRAACERREVVVDRI